MDIGSDISSNYGVFNPGTLNPHQLAQLLSVLSDESVDTTTLDQLQKKLSRSFIAGDSMKVRLIFIHRILVVLKSAFQWTMSEMVKYRAALRSF